MQKLTDFLNQLDKRRIWYTVGCFHGTMTVIIRTPTGYWEVDFFQSGKVEVEKFTSTRDITGEETLQKILGE